MFPKEILNIILNYVVKTCISNDKDVLEIIKYNECDICFYFDRLIAIKVYNDGGSRSRIKICNDCMMHCDYKLCYSCTLHSPSNEMSLKYCGFPISVCFTCIADGFTISTNEYRYFSNLQDIQLIDLVSLQSARLNLQ